MITCRARLAQVDDPDGHRRMFDRLLRPPLRMTAEDLRSIIFRRFNRVYDVDITELDHEYSMWITANTELPEKNAKRYMEKLQDLVAQINSWGVAHVVKSAIDEMDVVPHESNPVRIRLGVSKHRVTEFNV